MSTKIEWADETWGPTLGCDRVSPGCAKCYAIRTATVRAGHHNPKISIPYIGLTERTEAGLDWTGTVRLLPERLDKPLRWRKPRRIFVDSQSDLFHADVPDAFIARVWAVMAATPRHTYQLLTKRHSRARALLSSPSFGHLVAEEGRRHVIGCQQDWVAVGAMLAREVLPDGRVTPRPLPNVWVGVSAEDQQRAELRIPALLDTPAAVRFVSAEPLLGPIDLEAAVWTKGSERGHGLTASYVHWGECCDRFHGIDWVIVGGESGPGARPMHPDWARDLVEQCRAAHVPVFVKQLGSAHGPAKGSDMTTWPPELRVREWPPPTRQDVRP